MTTDKELEAFKFRLKIREILLDKLVLVLLLISVAFWGDKRLTSYENSLDIKLDQLREVYQFDRMLAQNEIKAHEKVWENIAGFRKATNFYLGKPFNVSAIDEIEKTTLELIKTIDASEIYLTEASLSALKNLYSNKLKEFFNKWEADGKKGMSMETWDTLARATDEVRTRLKSDIYARKPFKNLAK